MTYIEKFKEHQLRRESCNHKHNAFIHSKPVVNRYINRLYTVYIRLPLRRTGPQSPHDFHNRSFSFLPYNVTPRNSSINYAAWYINQRRNIFLPECLNQIKSFWM